MTRSSHKFIEGPGDNKVISNLIILNFFNKNIFKGKRIKENSFFFFPMYFKFIKQKICSHV